MKLGVALPLLSGCAQLFGINNTTGGSADGGGGAQVTFTRRQIGATVTETPLDQSTSGDTLTFLTADTSDVSGFRQVPGTIAGVGRWTGNVSGNPMVDYTLMDPPYATNRELVVVPSRDVRIAFAVAQHPDPEPPPPSASLALAITIPAFNGTDSFEIQAVGVYAHYQLAMAELPAMSGTMISATIPYASLTSMTGLAVARVIPSDVVVVLRHAGNALTGVFQTSFNEVDGTNPVAGTLVAVTRDQTFSATIDPPHLAARYAAVRPAVSGLAMAWQLHAAPGYVSSTALGPLLDSGNIAMIDTSITATYGNPFASLGWNTLMSFTSHELRAVTLPGGQMIQLTSGFNGALEPTGPVTLDAPAGLPQTILIDQVSLTSDNMSVPIDPATYAHVTMVTDHATNQIYQIILDEVVVAGASASLQPVISETSSDPQGLVLPPGTLVAGHTYTIAAGTYSSGFPNAATGDLDRSMPPYHNAYSYSGVFTVTSP